MVKNRNYLRDLSNSPLTRTKSSFPSIFLPTFQSWLLEFSANSNKISFPIKKSLNFTPITQILILSTPLEYYPISSSIGIGKKHYN